jgi:alpha-1,2-mannosyltransferase
VHLGNVHPVSVGTDSTPLPGGRDPARTIFSILLFGLLPVVLVAMFTLGAIGNRYGFDFRTFWEAARAVTAGHSPYPAPSTIASSFSASGDYEYFVYPPPFVLALLPFGALPFAVAAAIYSVLLLACVVATLAVLEVGDWRCYGLAFATIPVLSALRLGAVTPLLMLLAAVAWRYRDHWLKAGAAVGCATLMKLFLWPLVVWLLLTRRWRAAAVATGGALAITGLAWATLDFKGLADYPALLRSLSHAESTESYSFVAVADRVKLPDPQLAGLVLAVPIALALLTRCLVRHRSAGYDQNLFVATIVIALLLTPILWLNYFALLVVPIALSRKKLTLDWALLAALWFTPLAEPMAHPLWRLTVVLALVLLIAVRASSAAGSSTGAAAS